jgi:hypothetical protein
MTTPFESWARENRLPTDADLVSTFDSGRISGAHEAWLGAIERCLKIVETYEVSVGNSAAGEIACEMTMANLREIRDEIRGLTEKP